jgi:hypothetical protein
MIIAEAAAKWIEENTREDISEFSNDEDALMACVVWVTGDTRLESVVPRLGVSLIEKSQAQGRLLSCASYECEIANLVPDSVWAAHSESIIGLSEEGLAFAKAS